MSHCLGTKTTAFGTRWLRRFWKPQISSCRCVSISKSGVITLPDGFLSSAEEIQLELVVHWPILVPRKGRSLRIGLAPEGNSANCRNLKDVTVEASARGNLRLRARLVPADWADRTRLHFELFVTPSERLAARISLAVLDAEAVQLRVLENLRACQSRLWVGNRSGYRLAETVTASSGVLLPEFMLPPSEFSPFLSPFGVVQTLGLIAPTGIIELDRRGIMLGSQPFKFRGPAIRLDDGRLFAQPGRYTLLARIGQRIIARFPFRLVGEAELLSQVQVPRIEIQAHTRAGESIAGVTTLRWEEHKGFGVSLEIKSEISAPDTLASCTATIHDGSSLLWQEKFVFPLDRNSRRIKLRPVQFGGPGLRTQPKPARLMVRAIINGEEKASAFVLVLPPERITNFEGQLTFEVKDLPFDEVEYGQILHRLGVHEPGQSTRGFWRWLQARLS